MLRRNEDVNVKDKFFEKMEKQTKEVTDQILREEMARKNKSVSN